MSLQEALQGRDHARRRSKEVREAFSTTPIHPRSVQGGSMRAPEHTTGETRDVKNKQTSAGVELGCIERP